MQIENITTNDIEKIVSLCECISPSEKVKVDGFGKNKDLTLYIWKDYLNMVDIVTYKDGKAIDDSIGVDVLRDELDRIYNEKDMEIL